MNGTAAGCKLADLYGASTVVVFLFFAYIDSSYLQVAIGLNALVGHTVVDRFKKYAVFPFLC